MATTLGRLEFSRALSVGLCCLRSRSELIPRWVVIGCVVLIGALVGQSTLSFALAPLVIVSWAYSQTRLQACVVIILYTLGTSWTLVPSYAEYMSLSAVDSWSALVSGIGLVVSLWLLAALLSAIPWALLYQADHRWVGVRLSLLAVCLCLPPLGLFQWMNPFLGVAYLTPLTGWIGVIAGVGVLVLFIRYPRTLITYPIVVALSIAFRADVELPERWEAVQTSLPGHSDYESLVERFDVLRAAGQTAARDRPAVLLLGESVAGDDPAGARIALGRSESTTFLVGGTGQGGEAELWRFDRGEGRGSIAYRQRVPAPIVSKFVSRLSAGSAPSFMSGFGWLPFRLAETTIDVDGVRVAPLICYEGLTAWAMLSALWSHPDVIVLITNTAWSELDRFAHAQLASHALIWGSLFGAPVLIASNRAS